MSTVLVDPRQEVAAAGAAAGPDNRVEIADAPASARDWFRSVGAIIPVSHHHMQLNKTTDQWDLKAETLAKTYPVGQGERFADQPLAANGTAFLIHRQVIVTANHVVPNEYITRNVRVVFGYAMAGAHAPQSLPAQDVYELTPIWSNAEVDLALFMLDRAVLDGNGQEREPLTPRISRDVDYDEPLSTIGFPLGLPAKFAGGGKALNRNSPFFSVDLHVMRGNSGSPVFGDDGRVVGVLSTAPLGMTPVNRIFTADFTRTSASVPTTASKIMNLMPIR